MDSTRRFLLIQTNNDTVGVWGISQRTASVSPLAQHAISGWILGELHVPISRKDSSKPLSATGSGCGKTER
jgi:hypothetical protein